MCKFMNTLAASGLLAIVAATAALAATPDPDPDSAPVAATAETQHITVYVLPGEMGFVGPDHKHHDTFAPSSFVLHRGVPVTFTIVNYDDGVHTIFAPELGLNIFIKAAEHAQQSDVTEHGQPMKPTVTTYTFTPAKRGDFRWHCTAMCDGPSHWAMSTGFDGPGQDGYMAGWIKVL
jgi:heme/copper-type cytochrome/quinol oxidase subunit 2